VPRRLVVAVLARHGTSGKVSSRIVHDAMAWIEEVGYRHVEPSCALIPPTHCTRIRTHCTRIRPLLNAAEGHVDVPDDDLELILILSLS
jgi:hypothetical protein